MNKRFNVYGYWVYDDIIGLGGDISKGDRVEVFRKKGDTIFAKKDRKTVSFHITYLTKGYFVRP